ncbi:NADH-ubiquinone oxidoreductase-F iron-sulfur binding region domain-containing protein [Nocardiopsis coralliicola]
MSTAIHWPSAPASAASVPLLRIGPPGLTAGLAAVPGPSPAPRQPAGAERLGWEAHRAVHRRPAPLAAGEPAALAELAGLRGRGGAGFPLARKIAAAARAAERRGTGCRIVVNAAEGEPGSAKDRLLLSRAPHLVLDGAELAAGALSAPEIVVAVAGDGAGPAERSLLAAAAERPAAPPVRIVRLPERFLSGESGAVVSGVNGRAPLPPGVQRRAAEAGVDGLPTLLSNAETFAQLARLAAVGADRFAAVGAPGEPGTALFTVGGAVQRPVVVDAPLGTGPAALLARCGADAGRGVLVGGYHGAWLAPGAVAQARLSRQGLAPFGAAPGAGIVLPLGPNACPLAETARVLHYLAGESAGQCGPCIRGLPELARAFDALVAGAGTAGAVGAAAAVGAGRGACAHPDGAGRLAASALRAFPDEVARHAAGAGCTAPPGVLPLPGSAPPTARLTVDWSRCSAHGLCAQLAPSLVQLDRHGYPGSPSTPVPDGVAAAAARAVAMCPALALRVVPPEG